MRQKAIKIRLAGKRKVMFVTRKIRERTLHPTSNIRKPFQAIFDFVLGGEGRTVCLFGSTGSNGARKRELAEAFGLSPINSNLQPQAAHSTSVPR